MIYLCSSRNVGVGITVEISHQLRRYLLLLTSPRRDRYTA